MAAKTVTPFYCLSSSCSYVSNILCIFVGEGEYNYLPIAAAGVVVGTLALEYPCRIFPFPLYKFGR